MTEWLSSLEWGDVPTWLSSLGGIGALIAATLAARASLAVLKIETDRDKEADERAQRAQADLVAAWIANETPEDWSKWNVIVTNESKIPVYDVEVRVTTLLLPRGGGDTLELYTPLVPPGRTELPTYSLVRGIIENEASEDGKAILSSESGTRMLNRLQLTFHDGPEVR